MVGIRFGVVTGSNRGGNPEESSGWSDWRATANRTAGSFLESWREWLPGWRCIFTRHRRPGDHPLPANPADPGVWLDGI